MDLHHKNTESDSNTSHVENVEANLKEVDIYIYPDSSRLQQPDLTHHRQCDELRCTTATYLV